MSQKVRSPKQRMRKVADCCKTKSVCEAGMDGEMEEGAAGGGCGAQQPKYTVDGMKIMAEFKARKKSEDQDHLPDPAERKQLLGADKVSGGVGGVGSGARPDG